VGRILDASLATLPLGAWGMDGSPKLAIDGAGYLLPLGGPRIGVSRPGELDPA